MSEVLWVAVTLLLISSRLRLNQGDDVSRRNQGSGPANRSFELFPLLCPWLCHCLNNNTGTSSWWIVHALFDIESRCYTRYFRRKRTELKMYNIMYLSWILQILNKVFWRVGTKLKCTICNCQQKDSYKGKYVVHKQIITRQKVWITTSCKLKSIIQKRQTEQNNIIEIFDFQSHHIGG